MPSVHEIVVTLTARAGQFEATLKQSQALVQQLTAEMGILQGRMGQTQSAQAAATSLKQVDVALTQSGAASRRVKDDVAAMNARLGQTGPAQAAASGLNQASTAATQTKTYVQRLKDGVAAMWAKLSERQHGQAMAGSLKQASGGITSLVGQLKGLAVGYIGLQAAQKAVSFAFEATDSVARQERAWNGIAGSVAAGGKQLEFVRTEANKLGISFDALETGYRKIVAASKGTTLEGEQAKQIFLDFTQTMVAFGSSSYDVANAMRTVGQMITTGTIQGDELLELGNRLPGIMNAVQRASGKTGDAFRKMKESGGLVTAELLPKIAKELKESMTQMDATGVRVRLLSEEWQRFWNILKEGTAAGLDATPMSRWLSWLVSKTGDLLANMTAIDKLSKDARVTGETQVKAARDAVGGTDLTATEFKKAADAAAAWTKEIDKSTAVIKRLEALDSPSFLQKTQLANAKERLVIATAGRDALLKTVPALPGKPPEYDSTWDAYTGIDTKKLLASQKAFDTDLKTIDKAVKEYGAQLLQMGKSAQEIAEEQLKMLEKDYADLLKKYEGKLPVPPTVPGHAATMTPIPAASLAKMVSAGQQFSYDPAVLMDTIQRAAQTHVMDPALVAAVIRAEDPALNPRAVSPRGAQGFMQLMPKTAERLRVTDAFDMEQNIMGGTKYLASLVQQFHGDVSLALAAYNAGPGAVTKYGGIPPFKETQEYVPKVQGYLAESGVKMAGLQASPPGAGADIIQTKIASLKDYITQTKAGTVVEKEYAEALAQTAEDFNKLIATVVDSVNPIKTHEQALLLDQAAAQTSSVYAESFAEKLDDSTSSLSANERALAIQQAQMKALGMGSVEATEASLALARSTDESATAFENRVKALKANIKLLKEDEEVEKLHRQTLEQNRGEIEALSRAAREGFQATGGLSDGVSSIEAYERALARLKGLGASPDMIQSFEDLRERSTSAFQAIERGAADLASTLGSTLVAALSGNKDAFKNFEDFVLQTLIRIVMQSFDFEKKMADSLAAVGKWILKLIETAAGGLSTGKGGSITGNNQGGMAEGGFLASGRTALMGEAGRELYIAGGTMRLVGMQGPEVVRSRTPGFVIPHRQTMTILDRLPGAAIPRRNTISGVERMAHRALGGPLAAGQSAVVGERGMEGIVHLPGGGASTINVTMNLHGVVDAKGFLQNQARVERVAALAMRRATGRL